jgi:hypothetical protein
MGGLEQWISIHGFHRENPILLFPRGGPRMTSIPASYHYMSGWEGMGPKPFSELPALKSTHALLDGS